MISQGMHWKEYKKIRYAYSDAGFFWVIYPSGLRGQVFGDDENELKQKIDQLKPNK